MELSRYFCKIWFGSSPPTLVKGPICSPSRSLLANRLGGFTPKKGSPFIDVVCIIWVFPKIGVFPQNGWFIMDWGYPYFWKHPYTTYITWSKLFHERSNSWTNKLRNWDSKTVLWIFFWAAINLFVQIYCPCSEIIENLYTWLPKTCDFICLVTDIYI